MQDPRKILVVEDDTPMRAAILEGLAMSGYLPQPAQSAVEAQRILAEEPELGAVLTDVELPGPGDGFDVLDAVQRAHPETPVVVFTGVGPGRDVAYRSWAERAGAFAFLRKPFTIAQLRRILERALAAAGDEPPS